MKMTDSEFTKICGVCGDKAIAKNFGAVSCESCKAFFRRNASKISVYKCYFDNKCKIDAITRKFCRQCRLRKCFEIGMKQEWILSEEQKQIRRRKIEEKKQVRKDSFNSSNASDSTTISSPESLELDSVEFFVNNISDEEILTNILQIENYIENDGNHIKDEISDEVYQKAVELEFAVLPIARPMTTNVDVFNEMECNRLTELFSALNIMKTTNNPGLEVNTLVNPNDMCGLMAKKLEYDIQNLVTVSKNLSAFNNLCENDQISLLKYSSTQIFCMRSVVNYNFEDNVWSFIVDDKHSIVVGLDIFKDQPCNALFNTYDRYLKSMAKEWDSDSMIMDLLTAVVLFNPDRPKLIHRNMVKLQQQIYMYLLQRYLLLKYRSECESKEKFLRLLNIVTDLEILQKLHSQARMEKNPEFYGPLVREVLDMEA